MNGALIYSPQLSGHRQTYCQVMAGVLQEAGERVVVAGAVGDLDDAARAAFIAKLQRRGPVDVVDTTAMGRGGRDVRLGQLSRLVREKDVALTVLTEADDHLHLLTYQVAPGRRLPGRRVGVFLRTTRYLHVGRGREAISVRARRWLHGRSHWERDPHLFHEVLMPRFGLLDAALCLDEGFVASHDRPHLWLPDIFASFDERDWALDARERASVKRLERFCEAGDGPLLTYYGRAQARRGYVDLLRLAVETGGRMAHVGLRPPLPGQEEEVERLRRRLEARGALFETDEYLTGLEAGRRLFAAARCVVLPYRRHYGSSGVMLQALDAGRPVLVPTPGLMAARASAFGVGRSYPEGSFQAMRAGFETLCREGPDGYRRRIRSFMAHFRRDEVERALRHAFGLGGAPVAPPTGTGAP